MTIRLLMAIRMQLDAVQIQLDHLIEQEQQRAREPAGGCAHQNRTDLSVMGQAGRWQCKDCGYEQTVHHQGDGAT
jgi:hypothetical protein